MSLTQPEHYLARHMEAVDWAFPQAPPQPSPGQQDQSVEVLRPRTSPQAITAASTMSTTSKKRKRKPRPKLDTEKCARCRSDKVKCSPQPRAWPDKCERCLSKDFECSPGEVKQRARRKPSPVLLDYPESEPTLQERQASEIRDRMGQGSAEPDIDDVPERWDSELTNLVAFVQLINHERSLLAEAKSYVKKLNLHVDNAAFSDDFDESWRLNSQLAMLITNVRKALRDCSHLECLTLADRMLYENAHEAVNEDFDVPRNDPISEGSLAKLPTGVQIRYIIRKLRLEIHRRGSCDFGPLHRLLSQLGHERQGWAVRFSFFADYDWLRFSLHYVAAYSLVISQQFPTEPLIRIWVREYILRSGNKIPFFPVTGFAELWNADNDSVDLFTFIGGDAGDSTKLPLLHVAIISNKPRIVRALVKDSLNINPRLTINGYTAFHFAASIGSIDCYRTLLRCEDAKPLEGKGGGGGDLPLHIAARNGHKRLVDYILGSHFHDEAFVNQRNLSGETPLMQAAKSGVFHVVEFLIGYPGVDLTAYGKDGKTALNHAHKNDDIFRLILSKLPDQYFNTLGKDGDTPLHLLVTDAGKKAMQLVLSLPSILPDKEGVYGQTPLCRAVRHGNLEAVKALTIRRDVDVTKLSTCKLKYSNFQSNFQSHIELAKVLALKGNTWLCKWSQILNWLKTNCKELQDDLEDWEINFGTIAQ